MNTLSRPTAPQPGNAVLRGARSSLRVILAAYFLAAASAMLIDPQAPAPVTDLLHGYLGAGLTVPAVASFLFAAGGVLMLGIATRVASAALCIYLCLSVLAHSGLAGTLAELPALGGDLTLMAMVLIVAFTEPAGAYSDDDPVFPRRIPPVPAARGAAPAPTHRPSRSSETAARDAVREVARAEEHGEADELEKILARHVA